MAVRKRPAEQGVAILMVLTAVTLLAFILADFTFETKLNKLKVYNSMDKAQARLNAESGLRLALAKLSLYKEAINLLEKNESAKDVFGPNQIEKIITEPFMFPIPVPRKADVMQKKLLEDFSKDVLLQGQMMVEIIPQSGFLNPNNMRLPKPTDPGKEMSAKEEDEAGINPADKDKEKDKEAIPLHLYIEKELTDTLKESLELERQNNEDYDAVYGNNEAEMLVKELKFYVNNLDDYQESERGEIEGRYLSKGLIPKHAPLTSLSELYLLEGWNDAIVDLVKDRITVHAVSIIPLNTLTQKQLKVLFPSMTEDQLTDFFRYRDGDKSKTGDEETAHPFKSEAEFKQYLITELKAVDESAYDKRINELKQAGIRLGAAGKLFKVISKGEMNNAVYTITAFIDLPIKPQPPAKKDDKKDSSHPSSDLNPDDPNPPPVSDSQDKNKKDKPPPTELLPPRVIEIQTS
jgi:hypothetical protein